MGEVEERLDKVLSKARALEQKGSQEWCFGLPNILIV